MDKIVTYGIDKFFEEYRDIKLTKEHIMSLTVGSLDEAVQEITRTCCKDLSKKIERDIYPFERSYIKKLVAFSYKNDIWK